MTKRKTYLQKVATALNKIQRYRKKMINLKNNYLDPVKSVISPKGFIEKQVKKQLGNPTNPINKKIKQMVVQMSKDNVQKRRRVLKSRNMVNKYRKRVIRNRVNKR